MASGASHIFFFFFFFFDFDISNMPISEFGVTIGDRLFFSQCH